MAARKFKLSTVEMESFTDKIIKACLLQVQKGDKMMAKNQTINSRAPKCMDLF